ncbi:hypothetical protein RSAG8_07948, partial [Rhizoctonia solani AG-8 WAC10335]
SMRPTLRFASGSSCKRLSSRTGIRSCGASKSTTFQTSGRCCRLGKRPRNPPRMLLGRMPNPGLRNQKICTHHRHSLQPNLPNHTLQRQKVPRRSLIRTLGSCQSPHVQRREPQSGGRHCSPSPSYRDRPAYQVLYCRFRRGVEQVWTGRRWGSLGPSRMRPHHGPAMAIQTVQVVRTSTAVPQRQGNVHQVAERYFPGQRLERLYSRD